MDRPTSAYNNTLTINATIEDVIGEYSCTIVNSIGRSETRTKDIKGIYILLLIVVHISMMIYSLALEVSGHESPVIVGLSRSINCTTSLQVVRMEWVLVGDQGDPEEEREDGGQSLTLLLQPKSMALNGANFICRVTTPNGKKLEETVTVQVKGESAMNSHL